MSGYRVTWAQSSRKHRVGRHHVHVIATVEPSIRTRPSGEQEFT